MNKNCNIFILALFWIILIFNSCSPSKNYYKRITFDYPDPVDTYNKKIKLQQKKTYEINGIYADNMFDGARMNNFIALNDSTYEVTIEPENFPVNDSPWFAFNIKSDSARKIFIKIKYIEGKHRYIPKIKRGKGIYSIIDTSTMIISKNKSSCTFPINVDSTNTLISAQEVINTTDVKNWIENISNDALIKEFGSVGKSNLNRDIPFIKFGLGDSKKKEVIVLLSRQHPPEVTGFFALQSFIDEFFVDSKLRNDFFKRYEIWVFPLLNPDGVDLGHWRHNSNGIDLNRDWAFYRQKEIDKITQFIVDRAKKYRNKIILGLDFHSTQHDIYYVFDDTFDSTINEFKEYWSSGIDRIVYPFETEYSPSALTKPFSKVWFYQQFKAQSITYEVGDETDRSIIDKKARVASVLMMSLLVDRDD